MNKQAALEQIREEAFQDEIEKIALNPKTINSYMSKALKQINESTSRTANAIIHGPSVNHKIEKMLDLENLRRIRRLHGLASASNRGKVKKLSSL